MHTLHICGHGAGGGPRQALVFLAGRGAPAGNHSCLQECQSCRRSPARKQHLGLPGGAAGAIDTDVLKCANANAYDAHARAGVLKCINNIPMHML